MKALTPTFCIFFIKFSKFLLKILLVLVSIVIVMILLCAKTIAGVVLSSGWLSTDGAGAGANGTLKNNGVTIDWSSNGT